ncbi:hypothetical protein ENUP19_0038G0027 [Entamoeba nuttalli]|uniref:Uncharacterized protein n=1 Tax=Entamoeba nuttalli TaxID=412467 RepID=A0ABQ0D9M9_9EUKA
MNTPQHKPSVITHKRINSIQEDKEQKTLNVRLPIFRVTPRSSSSSPTLLPICYSRSPSRPGSPMILERTLD